VAVGVAILCFSFGSTMVKLSETPGPTLAFWRMLASVVVWNTILWVRRRRRLTLAEVRRAIVPGVAFGLNLVAFFTGVTHTTVANAEFIGALTPLLLVPAGALIFHEHLEPRALAFGVISLAGLALVLFGGTSSGDASWFGNGIVALAMLTWATYLITSRRLRHDMPVEVIMAAAMPIAALAVLPIALGSGRITDVTWRSVFYIALLTLVTGTLAHGLMVFAHHGVPVGTISIMQVGQPAIAVVWSVLFLDAGLAAIQIGGMVLVLAGLLMVIIVTQRGIGSIPTQGELAGPAG
jgi:drug/metabolite transporter (DMT)-like permease